MRKRTIVIFIIILFLCRSLNAVSIENNKLQNKRLSSTNALKIKISIINYYNSLKFKEYIYDNGKILSRLDWNSGALLLSGVSVSGLLSSDVYFHFELLSKMWSSSGTMEDSDWEGLDDEKTKYSSHPLKSESIYNLDINFGWKLLNKNNWKLSVLLGFKYAYSKFIAHDGFLEYPPDSVPVLVYGSAVTLQNSLYIPYLGSSWRLNIKKNFILDISGFFSFFTFLRSVDNHLLRDLEVKFKLDFGFFMQLRIESKFFFTNHFFISIFSDFTSVPEFSGSRINNNTSTGESAGPFNDSAFMIMKMTIGIKVGLKIF